MLTVLTRDGATEHCMYDSIYIIKEVKQHSI